MQKVALVNSTIDTRQKPRLRDRTDRAWFSCLLHLARKWSMSILSTPEPAQGAEKVMYSSACFRQNHWYSVLKYVVLPSSNTRKNKKNILHTYLLLCGRSSPFCALSQWELNPIESVTYTQPSVCHRMTRQCLDQLVQYTSSRSSQAYCHVEFVIQILIFKPYNSPANVAHSVPRYNPFRRLLWHCQLGDRNCIWPVKVSHHRRDKYWKIMILCMITGPHELEADSECK